MKAQTSGFPVFFENCYHILGGYRMHWPLETQLAIGNYGILNEFRFSAQGTLSSVSKACLNGEIETFEFNIPLQEDKSAQCKLLGLKYFMQEDPFALEQELRQLATEGTWNMDQVIIHEMITVNTLTLTLPENTPVLEYWIRTDENFRRFWETGTRCNSADGNYMEFKISNCTPFYRCVELRKLGDSLNKERELGIESENTDWNLTVCEPEFNKR